MKIAYNDLYSEIQIKLSQFKFSQKFRRGEFVDVPEDVGNFLLTDDYFVQESDYQLQASILGNGITKIAFIRSFALGDILLLLPIARLYKKKHNCNIVLVTRKMYIESMIMETDVYDTVIPFGLFDRSLFKQIIDLEHVLEVDHSLKNKENSIHRCKLYADFLNIEIKSNKELNWKTNILSEEQEYVRKILC
jgi:hypothetical protein